MEKIQPIILSSFRYYKDGYLYWRKQGVNGPFPIPIINNYYRYFLYPIHEADLKCLQKYGPIWSGNVFSTFKEINICEPELIREILIKDFRKYNGRNDGSM